MKITGLIPGTVRTSRFGGRFFLCRYAGDENNTEENIAWLNSLNGGGHSYTQCAEFLMDFHSPVDEADLKDTAWEPDNDYNDY